MLSSHLFFCLSLLLTPFTVPCRISRAWILLSISALKIQLSQAQRKVDKMSVRINLALEASEMFLSLHMIFSLERAAVVWAILERISGFDPSLEMIAPRYLKFSISSSLWLFILISLWKPSGLFWIVWADFHFVPCGGCIETVYQDASFFVLFCIYDKLSYFNTTDSCKWCLKMLLFEIISVGIEHIELFDVR